MRVYILDGGFTNWRPKTLQHEILKRYYKYVSKHKGLIENEMLMKNRILLFLLLFASDGFCLESQEIVAEKIAKWARYGAIAKLAREELSEKNFSFPYMDMPFVEQGTLLLDVRVAGACEVEKRVFALSDRKIVQYFNLCNGAVIAEKSYP